MSRAQLTSTVEQNTGGAVSPYVAGKNFLINGGMDVWQRGTSFSGTVYTADRWCINYGTSPTVTQSTDVPNSNFLYSISVSGSNYTTIGQRIESFNARQLVGKTITLSFWAKQTSGSVFGVALYSATAVDNFASITQISSNNPSVTSSWAYSQIQIPASSVVSSVANGLFVAFNGPVGSSTFLLAGLQLEIGSVATAFSRAGGTLSGELAACQRYYWRTTGPSPFTFFAFGAPNTTTVAQCGIKLPTTMRIVPNALDQQTAANYRLTDNVTGIAVSATLVIDGVSTVDWLTIAATVATGLTTFRPYSLQSNNVANNYIGVSAEL
jgi:hypothetical protein